MWRGLAGAGPALDGRTAESILLDDAEPGEAALLRASTTALANAASDDLNYSFADFNLVALPDEMDLTTAAGKGCRVTAAWWSVVNRARLAPG